MSAPVRIREARGDEFNFVRSAWMHSGIRAERPQDRDELYPVYPRVIDALLARSVVLLAVLEDNEDVYVGFVAGERRTDPRGETKIHYVYTKHELRGLGVARALVRELTGGDAGDGRVVVTRTNNSEMRERLRARGWGFAPQYPYIAALRRTG